MPAEGPGQPGAARVTEIDGLDPAACVAALAPLFEGAPRYLARLVAARPFGDADTLFARARDIAHAMPEADQVELIDAHPRLGAPPGSVSPLSYREQGYHRVDADTAAEADPAAAAEAEAERARIAAALARLNEAYEARFGFRYCVFVAGRSRADLLPEMEAALSADRGEELHRALDAVVDIARSRYQALHERAASG